MLNNPFCYTPSPRIVEAARALIYLREISGVTAEEVTDYVQ